LWQVLQEIGVPAPFKAMCTAWAPAMFGYAAPVPPPGGLAWQEVQFVSVSGDPAVWHTVHSGAVETGEVPVTAWQFEQLLVKVDCVAWKWVLSKYGTVWFTPGPPEWHPTDPCSAFEYEEEKQEGADESGAVRPCV